MDLKTLYVILNNASLNMNNIKCQKPFIWETAGVETMLV